MGATRARWQELKAQMEDVGVKTSMFEQNLGSALDKFDNAVSSYDTARKKRGRSDPVILKLAGDVRNAGKQIMQILPEYNENLDYLSENATDPRQKDAIGEAAGWTLSFMNTIRMVFNKLPS